jgi:hypothetical protein
MITTQTKQKPSVHRSFSLVSIISFSIAILLTIIFAFLIRMGSRDDIQYPSSASIRQEFFDTQNVGL